MQFSEELSAKLHAFTAKLFSSEEFASKIQIKKEEDLDPEADEKKKNDPENVQILDS